jgi:hypothetical protein
MSDEPTCKNHRSPFKRYVFPVNAQCEYRASPRFTGTYWCWFDSDLLPIIGCMVPECENLPFWSPLCEEHLGVLIDYEDTRRMESV